MKTQKTIFKAIFLLVIMLFSTPLYAKNNFSDGDLDDVKDYIDEHAPEIHTLCNVTGYLDISRDDIQQLADLFETLQVSKTYRADIKSFFQNAGYGNDKDDMASIFVLIMEQQLPDLANLILSNDNANKYLYNRINDGGTPAFGSTVLLYAHALYIGEFGWNNSVDYINSY
jgi:hypothetical protein